MWIAQCSFEQSKLFLGGFNRLRAERDSNDWMFRSKILQMRVQHPKEKIDIIGWLRNFENALVNLFACHGEFVLARIRERNLQRQFFCYEIDPSQPQRELLQKTAEHE